MILHVFKRGLYYVGGTIALFLQAAGVGWLLLAYHGAGAGGNQWALYGVYVLASAIAVVVHELGHLLACLALGTEVTAFRLGGKLLAIRFRVRTVEVTLGWPYKGRVEFGSVASVWRLAVITLAGALVDLALAGIVLAGSVALTSGGDERPLVIAVGLGLAVTGLRALLPYRSRSGRRSDGARLFELRADVDGQIPARLRREGRIGELLELHAGFRVPDGPHALEQTVSLHNLEWNLLLVPGLSAQTIDQAARRVHWVLANYPFDTDKDSLPRPAAEHTMALARLRQGRFAEVEQWCASGLATDLHRKDRATVLATIAMARRGLGQPYEALLAQAVALSWQADLVQEASAQVPSPQR
jgi:peptidase M50-like protein